ncbi:hypothetical protein GCM10027413_10140 [Conyzicola nivalis]|uniref:Uncharacterized protein n=1 Tax=Conyzicola nivalis TaxID=1477021 RepID=A0A916SJP4_9MICO|nr:hypothetical protein GCM10010979_16480 [Conyzicola nivalis]
MVADHDGRRGYNRSRDELGCLKLLQAKGEHPCRETGYDRHDVAVSFGSAREGEEDARRPPLADDLENLAGVTAFVFVDLVPPGGGSESMG